MGSTSAQAPGTRAANSAVRDRPVATRSRHTPASMSAAPAVEPMITPTTEPSMVSRPATAWKRSSPPAGPSPSATAIR